MNGVKENCNLNLACLQNQCNIDIIFVTQLSIHFRRQIFIDCNKPEDDSCILLWSVKLCHIGKRWSK